MIAAFLDANVLYPATLRSVLLELGRVKAFRILWSEQVHQEWMAALKRRHPEIPPERIIRLRAIMNAYVEDATVTGHEPLIEGLRLPDPDDRHVLAAAIRGGANLIVTSNERDFPAAALVAHNIEAISPDRFLLRLLEQEPRLVLAALEADRADLVNPPLTQVQYFTALEGSGLVVTASTLRVLATENF
jgi:predicted nucleic acid-binding protein